MTIIHNTPQQAGISQNIWYTFWLLWIKQFVMPVKESIEEIVISEFRSLCENCLHIDTCTYHQGSTRTIIQCELHTLDTENKQNLAGLCRSCDLADTCKLPGRFSGGVWHCNEYK